MSAADFAILTGGLFSALALGWTVGKAIKLYRQFFDSI